MVLNRLWVNQVIHAADKAQHHQRAVAGRHAGDEGAQPQQDNADILQGVIGQQALNVMLHQRIQSADKGGDHPQRSSSITPHHSGGTPPASETVSMPPYRPTFITTVENSAAAGALAPA